MPRAARVLRAVRTSHLLCLSAALWLAGCAATSQSTGAEQAVIAVDQAAALASACSGCHRAGGTAIPDLQLRSAAQIEQLLRAYKETADGPSAMHRMARGYSDAELAAIARRLGR